MNEIRITDHHDSVTELLPWYVNDTLDESERELVRQHISDCETCRNDVELLAQVQHAVRTESPAPLVPAPRSDALLAALDGRHRKQMRHNRWLWLAAASIVVLVGASSLFIWPRYGGVDSPARFETATSAASIDSINYVVELQFADGVNGAARTALFEAIDAREPARLTNDSTYKVTLALGSLSLTDLEDYIESIESRPEIAAAEIVAVQLPVE